MEKIKLKWEVVDLPNKPKLIIPDCLKSCFCDMEIKADEGSDNA